MTATQTDAHLSDALDTVSRGLDRLAGRLCDLAPEERSRVLSRLRRLSADVEALLAHVEAEGRAECQVSAYGEPACSH